MSLSKAYLSDNSELKRFSVEELARTLKNVPEILFAYILGSAIDGVVKPRSDLDMAFYLSSAETRVWDTYSKICDICESFLPGVRIDAGFLNNCEDPVYKFESIKAVFFSPRIWRHG